MKCKTAIAKALDLVSDRLTERERAEFDLLLEYEKMQIENAWVEGNRQGWEMNTDWPQDAEKYYFETYKTGNE